MISSLAEVKSIVLLADIPGASSLVLRLFTECFDILSTTGSEIGRQVEFNLNALLQCMVEESDTLPTEAVDTILAQFLHADPNIRRVSIKSKKDDAGHRPEDGQHKLQRPLPHSYTVARNLCNSCVNQMTRYVTQYFGNVIMDASSLNVSAEDEGHSEVSEEDMKQLDKAHRLLRELWRACPSVLQNIIPQIEAELSAESVQLRSLSTQAIGDLIAGIGAGGEVWPPILNPSAYPLSSASSAHEGSRTNNAPQSFAQTHPNAFQLFFGRRNDKSQQIRSVWASSVGRILATSAGGTGLEQQTEEGLTSQLSQMLVDSDERVRIAAIQALSLLNVEQIVQKLGPHGDMDKEGSVLHNVSERVRDRKYLVRAEAIRFLARSWASALSEIIVHDEAVKELLGRAPSKIFNAYYLNDRETNCVIYEALYEYLCPVAYPAIKHKDKHGANGVEISANGINSSSDPDTIRAERILVLIDSLDTRAKQVFFSLIVRPQKLGPYVKAFLTRCEEFNGGVTDKKASEIKLHLKKLVDHIAKSMANPERAEQDLNKFAKDHDRRSYALIRFCMAHDSDYRKIQKSLKELERKMNGHPLQNATTYHTIRDLVLRVSNLLANKSHVRPIITFAQTNEHGLGSAAHELLKHISTETPNIFKSHSVELCKSLMNAAPQDADTDQSSSVDSLKACASFARRFPSEVPKDRKFSQAMIQYALHGSPSVAAKHAVTILLSSTDSRQMYAKDLAKECMEDFQFGVSNFLSRLACLSQLMLLAAEELEEETDAIVNIAINRVLKQNRSSPSTSRIDWADEPDTELQAKVWALKILVNRLRHYADPSSISTVSTDVYKMLHLLVTTRGELSKSATNETPLTHRSRLHLQAAFSFLKLSSKRGFDALLSPSHFHDLCFTVQDPIPQVRATFVHQIQKLIGQDRLPSRFYCPIFLLAYEPSERLREGSSTWLCGRAAAQRHAQGQAKDSSNQQQVRRVFPTLESCLSRFLALLAHHPDFSPEADELKLFATYILYYLVPIATEATLPLIYHVAQRVKSVADALSVTWEGDTSPSENLYMLSDLAQAVIREFQEQKGWSMQVFSGKVALPSGIFKALPSHDVAQEIATRNYLPQGVANELESVVKDALGRPRALKRRRINGEGDDVERARKRAAAVGKVARAPKLPARDRKRPRTPEEVDGDESVSEEEWGSERRKKRKSEASEALGSEPRKSVRVSLGERKSYADTRDSDDEKEMEVLEWQGEMTSRGKALVEGTEGKGKKNERWQVDGAGDEDETHAADDDDGSDDQLSDVPEGFDEAEQPDRSESVVGTGGGENTSLEKDGFGIPGSDNEDDVSGSSKENAGAKKRGKMGSKSAVVNKTRETRTGTRTSKRSGRA